jgi:hypothetical protein
MVQITLIIGVPIVPNGPFTPPRNVGSNSNPIPTSIPLLIQEKKE